MKTVYVLGAGFAVEAGAPSQAAIIREAVRLKKENPISFDRERFSEFTDFLKNQLYVSEHKYADVDLEDIFTPLDRCLAESSQYRGIGLNRIMKVRESVFYVVGQTIHLLLKQTESSKDYINEFA